MAKCNSFWLTVILCLDRAHGYGFLSKNESSLVPERNSTDFKNETFESDYWINEKIDDLINFSTNNSSISDEFNEILSTNSSDKTEANDVRRSNIDQATTQTNDSEDFQSFNETIALRNFSSIQNQAKMYPLQNHSHILTFVDEILDYFSADDNNATIGELLSFNGTNFTDYDDKNNTTIVQTDDNDLVLLNTSSSTTTESSTTTRQIDPDCLELPVISPDFLPFNATNPLSKRPENCLPVQRLNRDTDQEFITLRGCQERCLQEHACVAVAYTPGLAPFNCLLYAERSTHNQGRCRLTKANHMWSFHEMLPKCRPNAAEPDFESVPSLDQVTDSPIEKKLEQAEDTAIENHIEPAAQVETPTPAEPIIPETSCTEEMRQNNFGFGRYLVNCGEPYRLTSTLWHVGCSIECLTDPLCKMCSFHIMKPNDNCRLYAVHAGKPENHPPIVAGMSMGENGGDPYRYDDDDDQYAEHSDQPEPEPSTPAPCQQSHRRVQGHEGRRWDRMWVTSQKICVPTEGLSQTKEQSAEKDESKKTGKNGPSPK